MDSFIAAAKAAIHYQEQLEVHRKQRRLIDLVLERTKGLSPIFLQEFTEQQLFNYYYRLNPPPKYKRFLRTQLPVEIFDENAEI